MSDYEFCKAEQDGHLTVVTINRPESMNALHPPGNKELGEIFDNFESDPEQWVAIITGAGEKAFSAGNDLKYHAGGGSRESMPASGFAGLTNRFESKKPIIAAVNGVAMGGGFEIALACDLIIASDNAVFALPEPMVGFAALAGGVHRLPRQIGTKQAMGILLTGRRVGAAEAHQLGIVNEVVPQADLMKAARAWADQTLACSPMSIQATKQCVIEGMNEPGLQAACAKQYSAVADLFASEDHVEGPLAFSEKRPPQWKGR
jgi:enoyl-CoA hydratase/carnithine racemase